MPNGFPSSIPGEGLNQSTEKMSLQTGPLRFTFVWIFNLDLLLHAAVHVSGLVGALDTVSVDPASEEPPTQGLRGSR